MFTPVFVPSGLSPSMSVFHWDYDPPMCSLSLSLSKDTRARAHTHTHTHTHTRTHAHTHVHTHTHALRARLWCAHVRARESVCIFVCV